MAAVEEFKSGVNTVRIYDDVSKKATKEDVRRCIQGASNVVHSVARRLAKEREGTA